jgi:phenylpyruvate tautomerase PptA (4-oxalocrotonate tautomerase family)
LSVDDLSFGKIHLNHETIRKEFDMPLIQLDTTFSFPDQNRKQVVAQMLSQLASEVSGRPEQNIMTCIRDNVAMTMSGAAGPCALVTAKVVGGLRKSVNQAFAGKVTQLLQKELNIPQNRIYLTFEVLEPTHWAWEGKTFG